jgi:hypothetical protein
MALHRLPPPYRRPKLPEEHFEVEMILQMKKMRNVFMALVQWVRYSDPTWEAVANLDNCSDVLENFLVLNPLRKDKITASNQQVKGSVRLKGARDRHVSF